MVRLTLLLNKTFLSKIYSRVKFKRCPTNCVKDMLRQGLVCPYEDVEHVPNFKRHGHR